MLAIFEVFVTVSRNQ